MTPARVAGLIERLPPGVTEIYVHPAISDNWPGHAPGYRYADEFAALIQARDLPDDVTLARFADLPA